VREQQAFFSFSLLSCGEGERRSDMFIKCLIILRPVRHMQTVRNKIKTNKTILIVLVQLFSFRNDTQRESEPCAANVVNVASTFFGFDNLCHCKSNLHFSRDVLSSCSAAKNIEMHFFSFISFFFFFFLTYQTWVYI